MLISNASPAYKFECLKYFLMSLMEEDDVIDVFFGEY